MIFRLAFRSLLTRPVRSAVLASGFGLGVAVMTALLGVGGVILEQAQAPALVGGGDVVVGGASGRVAHARFVLSGVLGTPPLRDQIATAAPSSRTVLYLVDDKGAVPVRVRGGIPSLERRLDDPETAGVAAWQDTAADRAWSDYEPGDVLRTMDRFHAIPDAPAWADSWAEWLYFNGRSDDARFYLTFLAGPRTPSGKRVLGVRLQLELAGDMTSYSESSEIDEEELLRTAPDLTVGRNTVRLVGQEYRITLDLPAEKGPSRATASLTLGAAAGKSFPPLVVRGANGWLSGYTVPVLSGPLGGTIQTGGRDVTFAGGTGYHDHNWGFWEGVSWQWGQVQGDDVSFVYGRVFPPADAVEPGRLPGFLVALGPEGPLGYATDVRIDETDRPGALVPERIVVTGRSDALAVTLDMAVEGSTGTRMREGLFGSGLEFLQLRTRYHVTGRVRDRRLDFRAQGSAETFRDLSLVKGQGTRDSGQRKGES